MDKSFFTPRIIRNLILAGVLCLLLWYFSEMVVLLIIAMLVTIVGTPLVRILNKIPIGKSKMSKGISVSITLLITLGLFAGLFFALIPMFLRQANAIASIDFTALFSYYRTEISWIEINLRKMGIIANNDTLAAFIKEKSVGMMDYQQISKLASGILTFTGSFFFNLFSVLFVSWYLLYDYKAIYAFIIKMVPTGYKNDTEGFLLNSRTLISRYILGLILDTFTVMISYAVILTLMGIKGAIVIAILAGMMNLIPYIGPVIGVIMGVMIGLTTVISTGVFTGLDTISIQIGLGMLLVIILDNVIYEPFIQGKSIHAHPLEIFLVIIAGEIIGGVVAMIVIIPIYGILKILISRYLHHFPQIQEIEDQINTN